MSPLRVVPARALAAPLGAAALSTLALWLALRMAVSGLLPAPAVALIAPASGLVLAGALFRAGVALRLVQGDAVHRRHGFWVVALGLVVGLPVLGAYSLVDPWETHYAEVAREMIERRDFVSPWWANEGFFMSKPAFVLWLEAASMKALGVSTGPSAMMVGAGGRLAHPEWAVRLPTFCFALVGTYVTYAAVARACGRRAGLFGALVQWTSAGFVMLSHQAMTDMPLVAGAGASLALFLLALTSPPEARVAAAWVSLGRRAVQLHAGHLVAALIVLVIAPQVVALALEHVHLGPAGLSVGPARFFAGSPHACGMPSQPLCAPQQFAHPRVAPGLEALVLAPLGGWLALRAASERRASRLAGLAAFAFAAMATMAKGPAGLVVPAAGVAAFVIHRRSVAPLARIDVLGGIVLVLAFVLPWYVAAWARHGRVFVDELVMRHMLGRTLEHLHDTNEGEDVGLSYVVRWLGFATFPWSGVLAAAALATPGAPNDRRAAARAVFFGAFLAACALVAAMRTKFHHYVLVALPPGAVLAGLWLDELAGEGPASSRGRRAVGATLLGLAAVLTLLVARDLGADGPPAGAARIVHLVTYRYDRRWPSAEVLGPALLALGALAAGATAAFGSVRLRARAAVAMSVVGLASALVVVALLARGAKDGGQREVFEVITRARASAPAPAPLVAYRLNWKGENFYSGNDVAIFVSSGAPMRTWMDEQRRRGARTFFFVTERSQASSLRSELSGTQGLLSLDEASDVRDSAQFTAFRANFAPFARSARAPVSGR